MDLPSGRTLSNFDRDILVLMHKVGFVSRSEEPFTLKSGIKSHGYVFGREDLTDNPELLRLIGKKIHQLVLEHSPPNDKQPCLIGIPTAGTALASAAAIMSCETSAPIAFRIMREVKKGHGAHQKWVNGKPDLSRHTYWLIDNVATNGASKFEANDKIVEDGYPSHPPIFTWIDRQQGADKKLADAGFNRRVIGYYLLDIAFAYSELGLWPKETVKAFEREIAAHQFV